MISLFCWATGLVLLVSFNALSEAQAQTGRAFRHQRQRLISIEVAELFEGWLAASGTPGAVVALVEGTDTVILAGYGVTDLETGTPVDADRTLFRVDDLVRSLTATAILQLADDGRLQLDGQVTEAAGRPISPSGRWRPFTVRELLLHTAGLDTRRIASRAHGSEDLLPLATYVARRLPARVRPPGELDLPSSHDYALAGWLVEHTSGRSFDAYLQQRIFDPLRMYRSTLIPGAESNGGLAHGHRRVGEEIRTLEDTDYPQAIPDSYLLTTGRDMSHWLEALVNRGSAEGVEILSPASANALLERQFTRHHALPGRTLAFREGRLYSPTELYLAARGHGFSSVLMILPSVRVGLFAAFNCEVDFWPLVYAALDPWASHRPAVATPPGPPFDSTSLLGYWRDASVSLSTPEKLASLIRQDRLTELPDGALGWQGLAVEPRGDDTLRERDGDATFYRLDPRQGEFLASADGRVWQQLPWFETWPVQSMLWALFTVVFMAIAWPRSGRSFRRPIMQSTRTLWPKWPDTIVRIAATLHLFFIVALAISLAITLRSAHPSLLYGVPPIAWVVLSLPWLAAAATLVAIPGLLLAWRSPLWGRGRCILLTAMVVTLLAFLAFLQSWNLLAFRL